jgi:hypothetical protein
MTEYGGAAPKLSDDKNVVRYVGGSHCSFDEAAKEIAVYPSAFDRNIKDSDGLSFIERLILSKNPKKDESEIRRVLASRRALGKTAHFAELNVGQALEVLSVFDTDFFFYEDPLSAEGEMLANPAHVLLNGLPFKGEPIGSLTSEWAGELLCGAVSRLFPAVT